MDILFKVIVWNMRNIISSFLTKALEDFGLTDWGKHNYRLRESSRL